MTRDEATEKAISKAKKETLAAQEQIRKFRPHCNAWYTAQAMFSAWHDYWGDLLEIKDTSEDSKEGRKASLLLCPFCLSEPKRCPNDFYRVKCQKHGCPAGIWSSVMAWNHRPSKQEEKLRECTGVRDVLTYKDAMGNTVIPMTTLGQAHAALEKRVKELRTDLNAWASTANKARHGFAFGNDASWPYEVGELKKRVKELEGCRKIDSNTLGMLVDELCPKKKKKRTKPKKT